MELTSNVKEALGAMATRLQGKLSAEPEDSGTQQLLQAVESVQNGEENPAYIMAVFQHALATTAPGHQEGYGQEAIIRALAPHVPNGDVIVRSLNQAYEDYILGLGCGTD